MKKLIVKKSLRTRGGRALATRLIGADGMFVLDEVAEVLSDRTWRKDAIRMMAKVNFLLEGDKLTHSFESGGKVDVLAVTFAMAVLQIGATDKDAGSGTTSDTDQVDVIKVATEIVADLADIVVDVFGPHMKAKNAAVLLAAAPVGLCLWSLLLRGCESWWTHSQTKTSCGKSRRTMYQMSASPSDTLPCAQTVMAVLRPALREFIDARIAMWPKCSTARCGEATVPPQGDFAATGLCFEHHDAFTTSLEEPARWADPKKTPVLARRFQQFLDTNGDKTEQQLVQMCSTLNDLAKIENMSVKADRMRRFRRRYSKVLALSDDADLPTVQTELERRLGETWTRWRQSPEYAEFVQHVLTPPPRLQQLRRMNELRNGEEAEA
ncbi:MAG: hypothetical protein MHM6MM_001696 [Cercozoa sp. M6MM]